LWVCLYTHTAFACRFNVREVGFVDLRIEPYYLFGYVNGETPADIISSFEELLDTALMESNIEFEIINTDQQKEHPAMKLLDLSLVQSLPAAVLVSPDGQSLPVPITQPNRSFEETLQSALDGILFSPKRDEILQQISKTYGAVLLIEGPNTQENKKAKEAASGAVKEISSVMEMMPKPIAHPPVIIVMDSESLSQEKVLLWSLGLDVEEVNEPHALVLYGRARWLGPMFKGEQITEAYLAEILFVIGQDCECGLDQRWLQGTMLPARWDQKLLAQAAESLGFDPENPMIKMEISSIVRRGYYSYPGTPLGYQEFVVEPQSVNDPQQIPPAQAQDINLPSPAHVNSVPEEATLAESKPLWQNPLYFIAALTVLVIAAGLLIIFRAARRNL